MVGVGDVVAGCWNRIKPVSTPGMTAEQPFAGQPDAAAKTMAGKSLTSIVRTARRITAAAGNYRHKSQLIAADQKPSESG